MLEWIRGKRFDRRTTILVLAIALIVWAIFAYVRIRDFVPEELRQERTETGR